MTSTQNLIDDLSRDAKPAGPLQRPLPMVWRLAVLFVLYALIAQWQLGLRHDLALQFARPLFVVEIALLALVAASGIAAAVLTMAPDAYQKTNLLRLPYLLFALLLGIIIAQLPGTSPDILAAASQSQHGAECALCIAAVSMIPSALMFISLRRGASTRQLQSGVYAVLAATATAGLTLRLAEANDVMIHLAVWHYLPTLLFAGAGALIGKWLLKW
ncbi:MAG: DUF1109 domain-containing protein [Alphaproteobacteria bacterium]|nr:DUF1109 domain-containing protein [Alphaproteobacteria bacterium]